MRETVELLKREPAVRPFFLAHLQSSLGNGAAYVALLVLAYDRLPSPWAVSLVLLADFLPAMALGPLFGAAADRWSRRRCAVAADVARAIAFIGVATVDSFGATLAFALLAGAGTGLFTPAVMAWLPGLVSKERLPAGTALFGAVTDVGWMAGPALAAVTFLIAGAETMMLVNGATFAISALLLTRVGRGAPAPREAPSEGSLVAQARAGMAAARTLPGIPTLLAASAGGVLFAGAMNVGELLLADGELGVGRSGFALLITAFGVGTLAGSLSGSRGGSPSHLKRRFLMGFGLQALGLLASGVAPVFALALLTFALTGFGEGVLLVHERVLLQTTVPDRLLGRIFGIRDSLTSWAFAGAFVGAGFVAATLGTRPLFLLAGVLSLGVWAMSALMLRDTWSEGRPTTPVAPQPA